MRDVTSRSATLQWRPVLTANTGIYRLQYIASVNGITWRRSLAGDSSTAQLTDLKPETMYTATLTPESNQQPLKTLRVSFTTLSGERERVGEGKRGREGDIVYLPTINANTTTGS